MERRKKKSGKWGIFILMAFDVYTNKAHIHTHTQTGRHREIEFLIISLWNFKRTERKRRKLGEFTSPIVREMRKRRKKPGSMWNSLYPACLQPHEHSRSRRTLSTNTPTAEKGWKASPEKENQMWMKQKIFPRHFCPVLRIKFFNPEKKKTFFGFSSCANTQYSGAGNNNNN